MNKSLSSNCDDNLSNNGSYHKELDFDRIESASSAKMYNSKELIRNFSFLTKLSSDSMKMLNLERSKSFVYKIKHEPVINCWDIKPPDLSYTKFEPKPLSVMERAKLKKAKVKKEKDFSIEKPKSAPILNLHAKEYVEKFKSVDETKKTSPDFKCTFSLVHAQDERIMSLKNVVKEPYTNPKKHDFRQYVSVTELGLPEFKAVKELDRTVFQTELLKLKCKSFILKPVTRIELYQHFI